MKKYDITQYDTTGQGQFESSWYGTVWTTDNTLKLQVKGMPFNSVFSMDKRAIPQLINILKEIQNDTSSHNQKTV
jgi:hypothetical protein